MKSTAVGSLIVALALLGSGVSACSSDAPELADSRVVAPVDAQRADAPSRDARTFADAALLDGTADDAAIIDSSGANDASVADAVNVDANVADAVTIDANVADAGIPAVIKTIPVGEALGYVVFADSFIWVAVGGSNNLAKIDPASQTIVSNVTVGNAPEGIAFDGIDL